MKFKTLQSHIIGSIVILALLSGCSSSKTATENSADTAKASSSQSMALSDDSTTPISNESATSISDVSTAAISDVSTASANEETKKNVNLPILDNTTGKTLIQRVATDNNTTFMITSRNGTVAIVDPTSMPEDIVKNVDIICITHTHSDHRDSNFTDKFNCKKSEWTVESFTVKDIKVTGIAASHDELDIFKEFPSNVLYVFEVDGLRIVHMGDIGQLELTEEQLKALGKIDIAFMQFDNSYSLMDIGNGKGFKLMEQLKPQIIIPTHSSPETTKKISDTVGNSEVIENTFITGKDDLKDGKRKVIDLINTLYE